MPNTLRQLQQRMAKLATRSGERRNRWLTWRKQIAPAARACLGPGQRIVQDQYEDAEGNLAMTWERITSDPSDRGLCYPRRYWHAKAVKEFNELARRPTEVMGIFWKPQRLPEATRRSTWERAPVTSPVEQCQPIPLPENTAGDAGAIADGGDRETGASNREGRPKIAPMKGLFEPDEPDDDHDEDDDD